MDLSTRSKSRFFDSGIDLRRKGKSVGFKINSTLICTSLIVDFWNSRIYLTVYYVNVESTLIETGRSAINEAITNAGDKLENNKAVKMISAPNDISVWISTNRMLFALTYKWQRKWTTLYYIYDPNAMDCYKQQINVIYYLSRLDTLFMTFIWSLMKSGWSNLDMPCTKIFLYFFNKNVQIV